MLEHFGVSTEGEITKNQPPEFDTLDEKEGWFLSEIENVADDFLLHIHHPKPEPDNNLVDIARLFAIPGTNCFLLLPETSCTADAWGMYRLVYMY